MKFEQGFNFHELVGLRVLTDSSFAADYFKAEYGAAAGDIPSGISQVVLRWNESKLPRRPDTGYRFKIHKALARWFYRVKFDQGDIVIEAAGNRAAIPMVHHMLVHGCLRYLCSANGALMLHAAAIAMHERSLVFAGPGGVGKTTVSSIVLDQGAPDWQQHADDYVFLDSMGTTRSYASRAHLYADFLKAVPSARSKLGATQRAHLATFGAVRRVSGQRIKWPLRVNPGLLWPNRAVASSAQLDALLFLQGSRIQVLGLEPIVETEDLVDQLIELNNYEARHTIELIRGFGEPTEFPEEWQARERSTLVQALQHAPAYRLWLPPAADLDPAALVSLLQQLVTTKDE